MKLLVEKIRTLSPKLNEIADRANVAFEAFEELLQESAPGIAASVYIRDGGDEQTGKTAILLAYDRDSTGAFRLGIEEGKEDADGDWLQLSFRPWDQSSRDLRVSAYGILPNLLDEIVRAAESTIEKAGDVDNKLAEIMDALSPAVEATLKETGNSRPPVTRVIIEEPKTK